MRRPSALHAAREQMVWIAALIGSTAIVVQLERLDLQQAGTALTENPFAPSRPEVAALLEQVRAAGDESDLALAQRATALTMALLLENPPDGLRAEAADTLLSLEDRIAESDDPLLQSAAAMLAAALTALGPNVGPPEGRVLRWLL